MKRREKAAWYFAVFIIGAFIITYYYSEKKAGELNANKAIGTGFITGMDMVFKGRGIFVKYVFEVKGDFVKDHTIIPIESDQLELLSKNLIGGQYPVIYNALDKSNSKILLFKEEFMKYGLDVPDSLHYIFHLLDSLTYKKN
ncbi:MULTISPECIES: hypothetical protein [Niastella]|uniref:Uncharacterized protein n=1 Tax=Niastella soli TaxID=2821487 RepID=A0ABS3YQL9_9BACT|nr:hypothetical protein [Niastella soli]MBO9199526.1 hypothetical protein [Niastella soli]